MLNGRGHDGLRFRAECSNFLILNLSIFRLIERQVEYIFRTPTSELQRTHQPDFLNEEKENDRSMPIRFQWQGDDRSLHANLDRYEWALMACGASLQNTEAAANLGLRGSREAESPGAGIVGRTHFARYWLALRGRSSARHSKKRG